MRNLFLHITFGSRVDLPRLCGGKLNIHLKGYYSRLVSVMMKGAKAANSADVLIKAIAGQDLCNRQGVLKYFNPEIKLQTYLFNIISRVPFLPVYMDV